MMLVDGIHHGNTEATRQRPMFGRGRLDHLGLRVANPDAVDGVHNMPGTTSATFRG
jgi:hypothetical protein